MKTAQEKQGYRIKTAQPVCGNCTHASFPQFRKDILVLPPECNIGGFPLDDLVNGTCKHHEWRK